MADDGMQVENNEKEGLRWSEAEQDLTAWEHAMMSAMVREDAQRLQEGAMHPMEAMSAMKVAEEVKILEEKLMEGQKAHLRSLEVQEEEVLQTRTVPLEGSSSRPSGLD